MHINSLEAYRKIYDSLPKRRKQVLEKIIELGEATIEETALSMNRYPNQISGRFSELRKANLIVERKTKKVNGMTCSVWTQAEVQGKLFDPVRF